MNSFTEKEQREHLVKILCAFIKSHPLISTDEKIECTLEAFAQLNRRIKSINGEDNNEEGVGTRA